MATISEESEIINALSEKIDIMRIYCAPDVAGKAFEYIKGVNNIMYYLESENVINIDDSGRTHVISKGNAKIPHNSLADDDKKCAIQVIDRFAHRSPRELEALATMDYVANNLVYGPVSKEKIINKFKEIKGIKFDEVTIENTFDELIKFNLITM